MKKTVNLNDLINGLRVGDISSYEKLYNLMGRKIYHYVFSFLYCKEDAEEIVHDVFIKVWEKRANLNENKSLQAYMYTITKNATLDKIRKYSVDDLHLQKYYNEHINVNEHECDHEDNHDALLIDAVNNLIEEMPSQRRRVFKLNKFQGMSQKSISQYLNISQGTVEKHISKAYQFLRDELDKRKVSIHNLLPLISMVIICP